MDPKAGQFLMALMFHHHFGEDESGISHKMLVPPVLIHIFMWDFPWCLPSSYFLVPPFEETSNEDVVSPPYLAPSEQFTEPAGWPSLDAVEVHFSLPRDLKDARRPSR